MGAPIITNVHQYCDVMGYVAPQNKFELKLPPPDEWNQNFFFRACAGFCGYLESRFCNSGLARGYASATGNGGHESALGFDGIWAANRATECRSFAAFVDSESAWTTAWSIAGHHSAAPSSEGSDTGVKPV